MEAFDECMDNFNNPLEPFQAPGTRECLKVAWTGLPCVRRRDHWIQEANENGPYRSWQILRSRLRSQRRDDLMKGNMHGEK